MQIHLVAFEGPDPYARAGGIASRIEGLAHALAQVGFDTHLWFVGAPERPGHERIGERLKLHRWCQWISRHHPGGVYDGEDGKERDFSRSLPPFLYEHYLAPEIAAGRRAVVLAEEWHTVHAMLHLDWILRRAHTRDRVRMLWNANNTFGFERIDFGRLASAATIATVSQYMRRLMQPLGCDPIVIPNGLGDDAYPVVPRSALDAFASRLRGRTVLAKVARWDPDKRWLGAIDAVATLRRRGDRPLLIARGGAEAHGAEVWRRARAQGLSISERPAWRGGANGLLDLLECTSSVDVVVLGSHLDAEARRLLFAGSHAVLANSAHEPFGLVGLETMAAAGVACTGGTGEEYARARENALVLEQGDPAELVRELDRLRGTRGADAALRAAGVRTAREYAWSNVLEQRLLPSIARLRASPDASAQGPDVGAIASARARIDSASTDRDGPGPAVVRPVALHAPSRSAAAQAR